MIGFPIFDRSTNPIGLTDFGREYIKAAEHIMDAQTQFQNFVSDVNGLRVGSITVGATNLFTSYILPPILSRFTALYPKVTVDLVEAGTAELTERLLSGRVDLIIENMELDPDVFERLPFCPEHLLLTVPKALASARRAEKWALTAQDVREGRHLEDACSAVPLELFKDDEFLFLKSGNDTRARAKRICAAAGFVPRVKLELEQQITAYNLSACGMGISFSGDLLISRVPPSDSLCFFKLGGEEAVRTVSFYLKRSRYHMKAIEAFLDCAAER